jgi:hypothetical protein
MLLARRVKAFELVAYIRIIFRLMLQNKGSGIVQYALTPQRGL